MFSLASVWMSGEFVQSFVVVAVVPGLFFSWAYFLEQEWFTETDSCLVSLLNRNPVGQQTSPMVYYNSGSHWKVSVMAVSLKAHLKALFLDLWAGWTVLSYTLAYIWADMVKPLFSPISWKRSVFPPCLVSSDSGCWRGSSDAGWAVLLQLLFLPAPPGSAFKCPGRGSFFDICPSGFPPY